MKSRNFHVSYQWVSKEQTGFGSIIMTIPGKLTAETVKGIKEYIDSIHKDQSNVIIALTELEQ